MKIATYNVNGIRARLPILLRWLNAEAPDVVCLQELKSPQENFPEKAIADVGYQAIWHGQKSWNGVAILARNQEIQEHGRVLPGDPEDVQSRYIEATVNGILIGCLYLPNGNPAPGPKFDYKLQWLERLAARAEKLLHLDQPVLLTGDFMLSPLNWMYTSRKNGWMMPFSGRKSDRLSKLWLGRDGRTPSEKSTRRTRYIPFGIISAMPTAECRVTD